jgi:integrase
MAAPRVKRAKVKSLGHGLGTVYERYGSDGRVLAYEHVYRDASGRQRQATLKATAKTAALKEAASRVHQKERGELADPSSLTFDALAQLAFSSFEAMVVTGERKQRSLDAYRQRYKTHLQPRLGNLRVQAITRKRALGLLDELRRSGASSATIAAVWKAFVWIMGVGREMEVVSIDLAVPKGRRVRVTRKRTLRILSSAEVQRVIAAATRRWQPILQTAAYTGARISEIAALQWRDVDFAAMTLSITKQVGPDGSLIPPKTRNGVRVIDIPQVLVQVLLTHRNAPGCDQRPEAFVFATDTGKPFDRVNAGHALTAAVKRAGIDFDPEKERISFHTFRHVVASKLVRANIDPKRLADHLGDDIATVWSTYVHAYRETNEAPVSAALEEAVAS